MKILFVFVFLLGLVSCNQGSPPMLDASENSSEKNRKKSLARCNWCNKEIKSGFVWARINKGYDYKSNKKVKCCRNKCRAEIELRYPIKKAKTKYF